MDHVIELRQENAELLGRIADLEDALQTAQAELSRARSEINYLKDSNARMDATLLKVAKRRDEYKAQLASSQAVARTAVRRATDLEDENARLRQTWAGVVEMKEAV